MKHSYQWMRPMLAALGLLGGLSAHAQQAWRPFRPGLIYAFSGPGSSSAHTLRLDSAYVTAVGDSAWTFGRLVKLSNGGEQSVNPFGIYRKSRNNLFGARLIWQRSPAAFLLENVSEGSAQGAVSLQLRPQTAVGSSWTASTAPAITATLTSRTQQLVGGVPDSVAVITLSTGQVVRLSRTQGMLAGPQWLATGSGSAQWTQAQLPATVAQSFYNPLTSFAMQPGDEMGYVVDPFTISPFPSSRSHILRRITTRQQTTDSLVFTYKEQMRVETFATPFGGVAGVQIYPVQGGRLALSLRTGKSARFPAMGLLTGEYRAAYTAAAPPLLVGRGLLVSSNSGSGCIPGGQFLGYIEVFPGFNAPSGQYSTGIDIGWRQEFSLALGLGDVYTGDTSLDYYRRTRNGTTTSCGSATIFSTLLPSRAAQAAAIATLHPNPALEAATLTLAQPARSGATLRLTDALGRTVWSEPVAAGQTTATVPLSDQPAGLYLLRLSQPGTAGGIWKLLHQ